MNIFLRSKHPGISTSNAILLGIAVLIVAVGAFAVFQSIEVQNRQKDTFNGWYENFAGYAKATTEVGRDKKPMVLYFYAPWCPHCKKFSRDLLSDPEVREYLASKYIRVRVYPEVSAQDQALMDAYKPYGASGYPSFFVIRNAKSMPFRMEANVPDAKVEKLKSPKEFIAEMESVLAGQDPYASQRKGGGGEAPAQEVLVPGEQ